MNSLPDDPQVQLAGIKYHARLCRLVDIYKPKLVGLNEYAHRRVSADFYAALRQLREQFDPNVVEMVESDLKRQKEEVVF